MVPHFSKAAAMVFRPLHAQVSEFQYKYRANTLILTGLWFENQKPAMNTFLLPFVLKMNDLSSSDVKLQDSDGCERPMKVYFGLCTVDCAYVKLWAWANLMGSVATLGARPSRVQVVVQGTGYCHVYPAPRSVPKLHTNDMFIEQAHNARAQGMKANCGVKGTRMLTLLTSLRVLALWLIICMQCAPVL